MANVAQNEASMSGWPPRELRITSISVAQMRGAYTPSQRIVIRNLSAGGLGARAQIQPPGVGETVIITIERLGDLKAVVKWVRGDKFGLTLSSRLTAAELEQIYGDWSEVKPGFAMLSSQQNSTVGNAD